MRSAKCKEKYEDLLGANNNAGGQYEYFLLSYVGLKLLRKQLAIADFKLSTNSSKFGKFDDVIAEITFENGTTETWAMQLKHNAAGEAITRNELTAKKGDFSVNHYFTDHQSRQHAPNTKSVLYTNKPFPDAKPFQVIGQPYTITPSKCTDTFPLDTSKDGSVYQFDVALDAEQDTESNGIDGSKQFYGDFYICADQQNVDGIKQEVLQLFETTYGSTRGDKYIQFVEAWWKKKPEREKKAKKTRKEKKKISGNEGGREDEKGNKEKLYKEDIEREIARIVLEPYLRPFVLKPNNDKANLLKMTISKFDVTLIDEDCGKHIENPCTNRNFSQDWKCYDVPLVIDVGETNKDLVCEAIKVLHEKTVYVEDEKYKFVLIGNSCVSANEFTNFTVFENLSDLSSDDYGNVAEAFSCVIQGRQCTALGEILERNDMLKSYFKAGHLLKMLDDNEPFVIGDGTVELPVPYINRRIPKHCFSFRLIGKLDDSQVLVITCDDLDELKAIVEYHKHSETTLVDVRENGDFIVKGKKKPIILVSNRKYTAIQFSKICSRVGKDKNVFYFELCGNFLNLLNTHGDSFDLSSFRYANSDETKVETDDVTIQDSEILTNFMGKMNVLSADPGMGKTICAELIKRICPFDAWPIKINLREKLHLFQNSTKIHDLLAEILNTGGAALDKGFQNYYKNNKRILLIWDGLDEVGTGNVDLVIGKIQEVSQYHSYYQWITCRCHLKDKLETFFNVISMTLTTITPDDQQQYIKGKIGQVHGGKIQKVCDVIHERIVKSNLEDVLGIPLLLHMFTTICSSTVDYEKIQSGDLYLTHIYRMFIDAKFADKFQEQSKDPLFWRMQEKLKAASMTNYMEGALLTCFGNKIFEELNLTCDDFLQEIREAGDISGLITTVADNETPIFLHKTFAEYLAASYLAKNHKKFKREFLKQLFQLEFRNIRLLFDMCLAEGYPAHQAVLAMNLDKLKELAEDNEDVISEKDEGGRDVLHLASSYGTRRPPLRLLSYSPVSSTPPGVRLLESTPLHFVEKENVAWKKIIDYLADLVKQKRRSINYRDKIHELNCVEYADVSLSLYAIQVLSGISELRGEFQNFLCNYEDPETLLAYSIVLGYENILSVFEHIPLFELFNGNHRSYDKQLHVNSLKDLREYNIFMLLIEYDRIDLLSKALNELPRELRFNINRSFPTRFQGEQSFTNAVFWAIAKGNLGMFKLLIQHGANLNGICPAILSGQIIIPELDRSIEHIDTQKSFDGTASRIVNEAGHSAILNYLIEEEVSLDKKYKMELSSYKARREGYLDLVKDLVQNKNVPLERLDGEDTENITPLLTAAYNNQFQICEYLLRHGADMISRTHPKGGNILNMACTRGNLKFIQNLPKETLTVLGRACFNGKTPLLTAASYDNFDVVKYLLDNGAEFEAASEDGKNILHYACSSVKNSSPFIKSLTKDKLTELIETQDNKGLTPLLMAGGRFNSETVAHLLENGANLKATNKYGKNILHRACESRRNRLEFIKSLAKEQLIELIETQDNKGSTPLLQAASRFKSETAAYLLENGANFRATSEYGKNILHHACESRCFFLRFVKSLTKRKLIELIETQDNKGLTPLLLATKHHNVEAVLFLLENGADSKATSKDGKNMLHHACESGDDCLPIIKILQKEKLIQLVETEDNRGFTPLLLAAKCIHPETVAYLLENGADFKVTNKKGKNIFYYVLRCHCFDWMFFESLTKEKLTELIETQDNEGFTPLLLATKWLHLKTVAYLLENGASFKAKTKRGQNILEIVEYPDGYQRLESILAKYLNKKDLLALKPSYNNYYYLSLLIFVFLVICFSIMLSLLLNEIR